MQSAVRHFKVDLARADPHWPAQVAALASILLFVALPDKGVAAMITIGLLIARAVGSLR